MRSYKINKVISPGITWTKLLSKATFSDENFIKTATKAILVAIVPKLFILHPFVSLKGNFVCFSTAGGI